MSHITGPITVAVEVVEISDDGHFNPLAAETVRRSRVFNVDESNEEFRAIVEKLLAEYDAKWAAFAEARGVMG